MDVELIRQLIQLMASSQVCELEYEASDIRLRLRRDGAGTSIAGKSSLPALPDAQFATEPRPVEEGASTEPDVAIVRSPIVGTFYRAPAPGTKPFVNTGDYVTVGKTLCIIEAMKVMNEIESDFDGKVVKILLDDSQPVEYGQPLMWIEPA